MNETVLTPAQKGTLRKILGGTVRVMADNRRNPVKGSGVSAETLAALFAAGVVTFNGAARSISATGRTLRKVELSHVGRALLGA